MFSRKLRVPPLDPAELTAEVKETLGPRASSGRLLNIYTTLARHPELMKRWLVFASYVLGSSTLPPREREIAILRTGFRCKSDYEWGQHARVGRMVGLTDEEIRRIATGPEAQGWTPTEALVLRAADELHDDFVVSDATWAGLSEQLDLKQIYDLVFTIGQYTLVSMVLNTLGIQREEGVEGFPE